VAITFENVIYDRVIDSLHLIIANEFNIPIYFDEHKGNQSFLISLTEDQLDESLLSGQTRNHTVTISYQLQSNGSYTKNSTKQVSSIMERLKRLLYNNRNTTDKFFNGQVDTIEYNRDDDNESLLNGILSFSCMTMEIL
tara:strand:+ start:1182 stop:1598 length:417 start_codon:yes stop_codon:yes gene_type:complete